MWGFGSCLLYAQHNELFGASKKAMVFHSFINADRNPEVVDFIKESFAYDFIVAAQDGGLFGKSLEDAFVEFFSFLNKKPADDWISFGWGGENISINPCDMFKVYSRNFVNSSDFEDVFFMCGNSESLRYMISQYGGVERFFVEKEQESFLNIIQFYASYLKKRLLYNQLENPLSSFLDDYPHMKKNVEIFIDNVVSRVNGGSLV